MERVDIVREKAGFRAPRVTLHVMELAKSSCECREGKGGSPKRRREVSDFVIDKRL
jgi:hypothetical protein